MEELVVIVVGLWFGVKRLIGLMGLMGLKGLGEAGKGVLFLF